MKVAVQCKSPLLERSLELFLEDYLSSIRGCDIVVRDRDVLDGEKLTFTIGNFENSDLKKPFSRAQLLYAIEQKYKNSTQEPVLALASISKDVDFEVLEQYIDNLTKEYKTNIINAVKRFYEK